MKKSILLFSFALAVFTSTNVFAVTHGSIIKKDAPLNVIISNYNPNAEFPAAAKIDFKAVTAGGKLWATVVGTGYELAGNNWSSQVRIYTPALFEISKSTSPNYITVNQATRTTIVTAYPFTSITRMSVSQEDNNDFNGPGIWDYNVNTPNSGLTGDTQKPVLTSAEAGTQAGATLPISCIASDNSGDYFYLVTDPANNYTFASFTDNFVVTGLKPETAYALSVVAIDFSGNESDPIVINIGEKPYESVLEGIAGDISFELGSTATSLQVRARATDPTKTLTNFKVQIGTESTVFTAETPFPFEVITENWPGLANVSYTINNSPVFTSAPQGIVYVNFSYLLGPIAIPPVSAEEWADVYAQTKNAGALTAGARQGERISIKMGDGEIKSGLKNMNTGKMTFSQNTESIIISSPEALQSVRIYSVSGQLLINETLSTIRTSNLSKGVYILKAEDVYGAVNTFKVAVK